MSSEEKVLKRYLRAVSRRLNLPSDVKKRVMSDFSGDLQARREAGMTAEEILAELGSPGKAAADLNGQMKEYAYRKSPWRFAFLALAIAAGCWLVFYFLLQLFGLLLNTLQFSFQPDLSASIGIIGGADGPTAVFVTGASVAFDWDAALVALAMGIGIFGFLRLRKCKQK